MNSASRTALRITAIYAVIGSVWILFSDRLVALLFAENPLGIGTEWWQSLKGLLFISITAAILYSLLARHFNSHFHALKAYRESEERWRHLLNQTPEPVIIEDGSEIVFVNRKGVDVLGGTNRASIVGRNLEDFILSEYRSRALRARAAPDGRLHVVEFDIRRLDGVVRHIEAHTSAISIGGQRSILSVWLDVTEREDYERRLIDAKVQAEDTARLKSTILTNLSHEIRTPLTAILGFAEMLHAGDGPPTSELSELIIMAGRRLRETLESILMLAELDGGDIQVDLDAVDIREVVKGAVDLVRAHAAQKNLELAVHLPETPVCSIIDATALSRILTNLLSNAVKFTDEGQVRVRLEEGDGVTISVADTGVGISDAFRPYLFEEFRQQSAGLTREFEGSGLGLSIARRLSELMGASIHVESTPNEGSTFTVHLPPPDAYSFDSEGTVVNP